MICWTEWKKPELKSHPTCYVTILQICESLSRMELEMISQALGHKHLDTTIKYLDWLDDELIKQVMSFMHNTLLFMGRNVCWSREV